MQTERVTILLSPTRKAAVAKRAAARGISVGEYARRRFEEDEDDLTPEQEAELSALVVEANVAIPKMQASIDRMVARLEKMNRENDEFLRKMGVR